MNWFLYGKDLHYEMLSVMLVQRDSIAESPGLKKNVVRHFLGNTQKMNYTFSICLTTHFTI